jgi:hypothetical protein
MTDMEYSSDISDYVVRPGSTQQLWIQLKLIAMIMMAVKQLCMASSSGQLLFLLLQRTKTRWQTLAKFANSGGYWGRRVGGINLDL